MQVSVEKYALYAYVVVCEVTLKIVFCVFIVSKRKKNCAVHCYRLSEYFIQTLIKCDNILDVLLMQLVP